MNISHWIIFNIGTELEFAECNMCGYEQEPMSEIHEDRYPIFCRKCKRRMYLRVKAEAIK